MAHRGSLSSKFAALRIALPVLVLVLVIVPTRTAAQVTGIPVLNTDDSGPDSLREAIVEANDFGGHATIFFELAPYPQTITLAGTLPAVTGNLHIDGPGADKLTISGNDTVRVLELAGDADLTLEGLTIADGYDLFAGAGIYSKWEYPQGTSSLTIIDCLFSGNRTTDTPFEHRGGAVYFDRTAADTLTITGSTFANNEAHSDAAVGGAIYADATVVVANSTFYGNQVTPVEGWGIGSAIYLAGGSLSMTHCTVHDNTASSNPDPPGGTGAIHVSVGTASMKNTVVAYNSGGNCRGTIADEGGNLQAGDGTSCGASIPVADPRLGPLGDCGGSTPTMPLALDSPAVDACACTNLTTDQRGEPRPFDWLSVDNGGACDIGAYEKVGAHLYLPLILRAAQ